jgi:hypothetical protein
MTTAELNYREIVRTWISAGGTISEEAQRNRLDQNSPEDLTDEFIKASDAYKTDVRGFDPAAFMRALSLYGLWLRSLPGA